MQKKIETWLKELKLAGYSISKGIDESRWISTPKSSLIILVDLNPDDWHVWWAEGIVRHYNKGFDSFDDLADWVNQKLRDWPDRWSKGPPL